MSPERSLLSHNIMGTSMQNRIVELPHMVSSKFLDDQILQSPVESNNSDSSAKILEIANRTCYDDNFLNKSSNKISVKHLSDLSSDHEPPVPDSMFIVDSRYKDKKGEPVDEELTSLTWLHDKNFINGIVKNKTPTRLQNDKIKAEDLSEPSNSYIQEDRFKYSSADQTSYIQNKNSLNFKYANSQIQFDNNNSILENENIPSMGATTTIHIGPSGTTTVVEYNSHSNFSPSNCVPTDLTNTFSYSVLSDQRNEVFSPSNSGLISYVSPKNTFNNIKSEESTPATHHPHKKYLREQMNASDISNCGSIVYSNIPDINDLSTKSLPTTNNCTISSLDQQTKYGHFILESPSSYSNNSQETDSLKDFDTTNIQKNLPSLKQKLSVPYDPKVHTQNKPPYSFSSLIFMAIEDSSDKALPVKEIYAWIVMHFPYFKTAPTGWKNSVRHNLSLNKSFVKVEKAPNMGKGSLWRVEQTQRSNLIQSLSRSPFFNCSGANKTAKCTSESVIKSHIDAALFPKLSKKMVEIGKSKKSDKLSCSKVVNSTESMNDACVAENLDDVKAATAMLALKHGPKVFNNNLQNNLPVITYSPSEDHTYSAGGISFNEYNEGNTICNSSLDASYESGEEFHNRSTLEELEEQRQRDGVDALLSLSKMFDISPVKRPASNTVEEEHLASYIAIC